MAFKKLSRFLKDGQNPHGFRAVISNGEGEARDPTQGPPSGSGIGLARDRSGERWGQLDRGSRDNSGSQHDW
jgi:hypothetical protein